MGLPPGAALRVSCATRRKDGDNACPAPVGHQRRFRRLGFLRSGLLRPSVLHSGAQGSREEDSAERSLFDPADRGRPRPRHGRRTGPGGGVLLLPSYWRGSGTAGVHPGILPLQGRQPASGHARRCRSARVHPMGTFGERFPQELHRLAHWSVEPRNGTRPLGEAPRTHQHARQAGRRIDMDDSHPSARIPRYRMGDDPDGAGIQGSSKRGPRTRLHPRGLRGDRGSRLREAGRLLCDAGIQEQPGDGGRLRARRAPVERRRRNLGMDRLRGERRKRTCLHQVLRQVRHVHGCLLRRSKPACTRTQGFRDPPDPGDAPGACIGDAGQGGAGEQEVGTRIHREAPPRPWSVLLAGSPGSSGRHSGADRCVTHRGDHIPGRSDRRNVHGRPFRRLTGCSHPRREDARGQASEDQVRLSAARGHRHGEGGGEALRTLLSAGSGRAGQGTRLRGLEGCVHGGIQGSVAARGLFAPVVLLLLRQGGALRRMPRPPQLQGRKGAGFRALPRRLDRGDAAVRTGSLDQVDEVDTRPVGAGLREDARRNGHLRQVRHGALLERLDGYGRRSRFRNRPWTGGGEASGQDRRS
ncbi:MAG: hypothetical protein BWX47_01794 [candidate division Hyd24-12 bacterium ADurb.Bin004]|nr:MAG: hypothetical protein BWX47_01794 [candidate division Hyd24-12 bacterium ADurb.Bin004]